MYSCPVRKLLRVGILVFVCWSHAGASPAGPLPLVPVTARDLLARVREPGADVVVVNVWATWCLPCRKEFPDLLRLRSDDRKIGLRLRLLLVSADFPDQTRDARRFLADQGVDFLTFLKKGKDMEFIQALDPRWTGALPATFVYDAHGNQRAFHEGRLTRAAMDSLVAASSSSNRQETSR
ncbi:MAG: TlpA family protein disulfide reductase [Candidatus Eisenbacteria bacterium]|uniref:TlpA family protein disulfide reductase n=1 Tax=Eiseniibacteriota bacterium TaxID=2212470 RepID=A0A538U7I0_UNCEI|nr:MAG: TlpA family protein disulfide reductase [Candidatus Eisenbacteria bacterium]